jgi:hypothetical protein
MVRSGELTAESAGHTLRVGVNQTARAVAGDPLAEEVLLGLAEGWLAAPRNFAPSLPPPPLSTVIPDLIAHET